MRRGATAMAFALGLGILAGCASRPVKPLIFPEAALLPSQPAMPDPLVMFDGRRVTSRKQWVNERRPELRAQFAHYMYGPIPPRPAFVQAKVAGEYRDFLGGQATLRLVTLETGPAGAPQINLLLVLPNGRRQPVPVFLAMNFNGNQALTDDSRVPLRVGETARGTERTNWPIAEIVRRGYALAAFYSGDIDPDRADSSTGLYAFLAGGDPAKNVPASRGTLAAWAWGFQRCVDYLVTDPDLDSQRIAAVGHSRNGKATLLAAAFDDRIAMAFPHQAGCGGTSPNRGKIGESVQRINTAFPHWFNAEFKTFNTMTDRLPFDQNCLVALCAPRPVLFSNALDDQWANPAGQFEVLQAADPVYRFLGVEGLKATAMPPLGTLVDSRLGYFIREGKHSMIPVDWAAFTDFADHQWSKAKR